MLEKYSESKVWIAWEDHRRSRELAKALGMQYKPIFTKYKNRFVRYPILSYFTFNIILAIKPKVIVCQNPSIILTTMLCFVKKIFNFKLIVDRHTNFKFKTLNSKNPKWYFFHLLSRYTIKAADLTIVTNEPLKKIVNDWGGNGFVLQDKLPEMSVGSMRYLEGVFSYIFVCTYSDDEPYEKVVEAFQRLERDKHLYITGNFKKWKSYMNGGVKLADNIHLTGFLSEEDYQSLIKSVDVVIVFTELEYVLNCGAYEGMSVEKPLILSNTKTIKDYFKKGVIHTDLDIDSISEALIKAQCDYSILKKNIKDEKEVLSSDWLFKFEKLKNYI